MPPPDIEKGASQHADDSTLVTDVDGEASLVNVSNLPPLKQQSTVLSTRSAREALRTLENFEQSPDNPRNWPNGRKWRTTLTVAVTGFIATCGSSIAVPGIHQAMEEFGYTNEKIGILVTAAYVLGMGVGPFVFAPISELYGRQVAYQSAQSCYILFCMASALAPNMVALIVFRFLCGVFASVGPSLGVATCADVFIPQERGRPVSIYALGPMAGPVLGSMLGYWILFGGWRWLHWTIMIMAGLNWILLVSLTQETYAPVIHKKLQYRVRHPQADITSFAHRVSPRRILHDLGWMRAMVSREEAASVFGRAFSRPPRMLFGNPVVFFFAAYYAYLYGIIYVFLVSIPLLFGSPPLSSPGLFSYGWPQATVGFGYVGMAVGFGLAATIAATQQDRIYKYLSKRQGTDGEPEYRLVLTQIGMLFMPVGLLMFGWMAQAETHWMGPLVAQGVIAINLMMSFNSLQAFLVDAFFPYSASAIACATALRSVVACILPIFSPQMFVTLGWGWADTLLAGVGAIAVPAPWIMFKYGKRLRDRYQFHG